MARTPSKHDRLRLALIGFGEALGEQVEQASARIAEI